MYTVVWFGEVTISLCASVAARAAGEHLETARPRGRVIVSP
jgi:hypothetical protein